MKVGDKHYRTIWLDESDSGCIKIIDQRHLPHKFLVESLSTVSACAQAIKDMHVRGAGLIGATAGYAMYLATLEAVDHPKGFDHSLVQSAETLLASRPTAVNLSWAVDRQLLAIRQYTGVQERINIALSTAEDIANEDVKCCQSIGNHGQKLIEDISKRKPGPVNVLTHCNAGWLAFVDYGSATAPIYTSTAKGIDVHVWVDETRPRNQGARLTAWELNQQGIPHTVIPDNTGGHLMQKGMVDLVIVGTDRTTYTGDVANKIGTYLKALAAYDNNIPFYVALPSSSFDWVIRDGMTEIPIEERAPEEVKYIKGLNAGDIKEVLLTPPDSPTANYAFDVTPSRLISGLITERGICEANEESILNMFPEKKSILL
jgi:methylthioribose-1-phosphate isomerase